ncbi:MAG: hypothetical protein JNK53_07330, partial [Phycisphaerae bacterium]|nr:hypothetical protein [Phycisphaerae bacterium]
MKRAAGAVLMAAAAAACALATVAVVKNWPRGTATGEQGAPTAPTEGELSLRETPPPLDEEVAARVRRNPPLGPVPADPTNRYADSEAAAELGHRIFFDPAFSVSGTVSCATCHDPAHGFADTRTLARGEGTGTRHSMSVLNSAHNRWFTWDGRADTQWSQAIQPFEALHEHGLTRARIVERVLDSPELRAGYERAFGVAPSSSLDAAAVDATVAHIGKAIAAYERKLVTGPSAYDRWWTKHEAGDPSADDELTAEARRGLVLFFGKGNCWECHHGANFTDGEFHMIGVPTADRSAPTDPGRYAVVEGVRDNPFNAAGPHSDDREGRQARISAGLVRSPDLWGQFKTPSLRTAAQTPPYMHRGQLATLPEVVRFYSTLEGAVSLDHHQELV